MRLRVEKSKKREERLNHREDYDIIGHHTLVQRAGRPRGATEKRKAGENHE